MHYFLVICRVSSTDQNYHRAAKRRGDKFDRSMTLGKLLGSSNLDSDKVLGSGQQLQYRVSIMPVNNDYIIVDLVHHEQIVWNVLQSSITTIHQQLCIYVRNRYIWIYIYFESKCKFIEFVLYRVKNIKLVYNALRSLGLCSLNLLWHCKYTNV